MIPVFATGRNFLENQVSNPYNGQPHVESFDLGLLVAGYDPGSERAKEYLLGLRIQKDANGSSTLIVEGPTLIKYVGRKGSDVGVGVYVNGQPEAAHRLIKGYGALLASSLEVTLPDPADQVDVDAIRSALFTELVSAAMPIQDAIDLAIFLIETTTNYLRFSVGPQTVGGPIEVAAITKYEGFKWVQRKSYYSQELNP